MSSKQREYLKKLKYENIFILVCQILLLVAFLTLWELAAKNNWIESFIFSSPSRIIACFRDMLLDGSLFMHTSITIGETLISFSLIFFLGITTAILLWLCTPLARIVEPYLIMLNSLPKSALAPMLIVWLGANKRAIIVTAVSIALFGTIINIYTGFTETDSDKLKLLKTFGANRLQILLKLVLPGSLNTIMSNMKVNIGLCLVGVIIGEFLAAKAGLGYIIIYNSQIFSMDKIAMSILILCLMSIILFKCIDIINLIIKKLKKV